MCEKRKATLRTFMNTKRDGTWEGAGDGFRVTRGEKVGTQETPA